MSRMKQVEQQLRDTDQRKDEFLATLAHELRNPLAPISNALQVLKRTSDPVLGDQTRGIMERKLQYMVRLIDDLLDYTRIGKGTMELHREEVDAHSMLRNVIQICDEARGSSGRQIIVELDAARHHLHADPVRLQQVFWHLIRNAIRFTPEGGTVIIRTDDAPGGSFRAAITDAGTGFDPEAAATLFDTFGRGAHHYGLGIGLGLSIAKGIVEMHGGTIAASSPGPGKGASFTVELSPLPPEGEEGRGAAASPASGGRVLLVEDHADTRRVLELMLRRWGYEVKAAATVEEGAALAADTTFDLIISDTQLPDGDGEELLRRIDPERKLKAIALGGFGEEEERQRSREAGFAEHIAKPVTTRELLAAIRATLG